MTYEEDINLHRFQLLYNFISRKFKRKHSQGDATELVQCILIFLKMSTQTADEIHIEQISICSSGSDKFVLFTYIQHFF